MESLVFFVVSLPLMGGVCQPVCEERQYGAFHYVFSLIHIGKFTLLDSCTLGLGLLDSYSAVIEVFLSIFP